MKRKSYKVNNDIYDIPENEVSSFLTEFPDAIEVESFTVDKDTFDIPIAEIEEFKAQFPTAQPLKKKDITQPISESGGIGSEAVPFDTGMFAPMKYAIDQKTIEVKNQKPNNPKYTLTKGGKTVELTREQVFDNLENQDFLKGIKSGEADIEIKNDEGLFNLLVDKVNTLIEPEAKNYFIDGAAYTQKEFTQKLFQPEIIEKLQNDNLQIDIPQTDAETQKLVSRQKEAGGQLGDKWDSFVAGLYDVAGSALGLKSYIERGLNYIFGTDVQTPEAQSLAIKGQELKIKAEESREKVRQYEFDFLDAVGNGNYTDATNIAFNSLSETLPIIGVGVATSGAGVAPTMATMGALSASGELMELDKAKKLDGTELTEGEKLGGATVMGAVEAGLGYFPTTRIVSKNYSILKEGIRSYVNKAAQKGGIEAGQKFAAAAANKTAPQLAKDLAIDNLLEVGGETATGFFQDLTTNNLGTTDYTAEELIDRAKSNAAQTLAVSGLMTSPTSYKLAKKIIDPYIKKNQEKVKADIDENPNIPKDEKQQAKENIDKRAKAINAVPSDLQNNVDVVDKIQEKQSLEEEAKNLDPIFQTQIQEKISELGAELIRLANEKTSIPTAEIKDLAQRIAKGEKIESAEDLQLQANYPSELETELKQLASGTTTTPTVTQKEATPQAGSVVGGDVVKIGAKKADIERRRQEELNKPIQNFKNAKTKEDLIKAGQDWININPYDSADSPMNVRSALLTTGGFEKGKELFIDFFKKADEIRAKQINAKYDAELKSAEQSLQSTPQAGSVVGGENPALKDVESTAKALEGVDISKTSEIARLVSKNEIKIKSTNVKDVEKLLNQKGNPKKGDVLNIGGTDWEVNKINKRQFWDSSKREFIDTDGYEIQIRNSKNGETYTVRTENNKPFKGEELSTREKLSNYEKQISEAYHKAKADGSNPELVKAVEDLLGKPTEKQKAEAKPKQEDVEDWSKDVESVVYSGSPIFKEKGELTPSKSGELGAGSYFTRSIKTAENYSQPRGEVKNLAEENKKRGIAAINIKDLNIKQLTKQEYLDTRSNFYDEEQKLNNGDWNLDIVNSAERKLIEYYEKQGYDGLEVKEENQGVIFPNSIKKAKVKAVEELLTPKIEQDAEKQQSFTLREQSVQETTERKSDSDMPIVNEAELQDRQVVEEKVKEKKGKDVVLVDFVKKKKQAEQFKKNMRKYSSITVADPYTYLISFFASGQRINTQAAKDLTGYKVPDMLWAIKNDSKNTVDDVFAQMTSEYPQFEDYPIQSFKNDIANIIQGGKGKMLNKAKELYLQENAEKETGESEYDRKEREYYEGMEKAAREMGLIVEEEAQELDVNNADDLLDLVNDDIDGIYEIPLEEIDALNKEYNDWFNSLTKEEQELETSKNNNYEQIINSFENEAFEKTENRIAETADTNAELASEDRRKELESRLAEATASRKIAEAKYNKAKESYEKDLNARQANMFAGGQQKGLIDDIAEKKAEVDRRKKIYDSALEKEQTIQGLLDDNLKGQKSIFDRLNDLKIKGDQTGLLMLAPKLFNDFIDVIRAGIKAGMILGDAIKKGIDYLKANGVTDVEPYLNEIETKTTEPNLKKEIQKLIKRKPTEQKRIDRAYALGIADTKEVFKEKIAQLKSDFAEYSQYKKEQEKEKIAQLNELKKNATDLIKSALNKDFISQRTFETIMNRLGKATTPTQYQKLFDYISKAAEQADYAEKLDQAKTLQSKVKSLAKSERNFADQKDISKALGRFNIEALEDLDAYNKIAQDYINSMLPVNNPKYKPLDINEALTVLAELQNEIDQQLINKISNEYGFSGLTKEEAEILNEVLSQDNVDLYINNLTQAKQKQIRDIALKQAEYSKIGINEKLQQEPNITSAFTEMGKSWVNVLKDADFTKAETKQLIEYIRTTDNFIANNSLSNVGKVAQMFNALKNITPLQQATSKSKLFEIGRIQKSFESVPVLLKSIFGTSEITSKFRNLTGFDKVFTGGSKSNVQLDEKYKEWLTLKKNLKIGDNLKDIQQRGVYSYLIQNYGGSSIDQNISYEENVSKLLQSIEALRQSGNQNLTQVSQVLQEIYDTDVAPYKTLEEFTNNFKQKYPKQVKAQEFWNTTFGKIEPQLKEISEGYENESWEGVNNYTPISYTFIQEEMPDINDAESVFAERYPNKPKQSPTTIKRVKLINIPEGMAVSFDFDANMFNKYKRATYDINTMDGRNLFRNIYNNKTFTSIIGGNNNAKSLRDVYNSSEKLQRGAYAENSTSGELLRDLTQGIRNIGVSVALGGFTQYFKQYPSVAVKTLFSLGKNADLFFRVQNVPLDIELFNQASIQERGARAGGTDLGETERNLISSTTAKAINKYTKGFSDYTKKVRDLTLLSLQQGDVRVAKRAFLANYMGYLKRNGIDIQVSDLATEHTRMDDIRNQAVSYAQQVIDEQQVVSNASLLAEFQKGDGNAFKEFFRNSLLPFNTFSGNVRARMIEDLKFIRYGTEQQRTEAIKDIVTTTAEIVTFQTISKLLLYALLKYPVSALLSEAFDLGDEEDFEEQMAFKFKQWYTDVLRDMTVGGMGGFVEGLYIKGLNYGAYFIDEANKIDKDGKPISFTEWSKENAPLYTYPDKDKWYDQLGGYGVAYREYSKYLGDAAAAVSGEFKDEYSFVKRSENEKKKKKTEQVFNVEEYKELSPQEQRFMMFLSVTNLFSLAGLRDADISSMLQAKKRNILSSKKNQKNDTQIEEANIIEGKTQEGQIQEEIIR